MSLDIDNNFFGFNNDIPTVEQCMTIVPNLFFFTFAIYVKHLRKDFSRANRNAEHGRINDRSDEN